MEVKPASGVASAGVAIGNTMAKFGNLMEKKEQKSNEVGALKKLYGQKGGVLDGWSDEEIQGLANGSALQTAIKSQDEQTAKKNLIAGYRIKHPKFSQGLDDNQLYEYVKFAGQSVIKPDNGKVIDVHTDPKGKRYASVRRSDGTIVNEYLGDVKVDYNTKKEVPSIDLTAQGDLSKELMKKAQAKKTARMKIDDKEL